MIVTLKKNIFEEDEKKLLEFFDTRKIKYKDISSHKIRIFYLYTNAEALEINDLYRFEAVETVNKIHKSYKKAYKAYKEKTIIKLSNGVEIGNDNFTVIAGPCSVESFEQMDQICKTLVSNNCKIVRGGAFKPRTSPYSFQGLELEGLNILFEMKKKYNICIISEIPSLEYLNEFIEKVDIIQVGARNMQNYSLLKELGKIKKPILLKRGNSALIEEWLLSAEYIMQGGNEEVILCERGIRTFETYTRNTLDISSVLAVKELSHLPIIVDPSHGSGRYTMVEGLTKASLAVKADGVMIEVHQDPQNALSDGFQSINLKKFTNLMKDLKIIASAIKMKV